MCKQVIIPCVKLAHTACLTRKGIQPIESGIVCEIVILPLLLILELHRVEEKKKRRQYTFKYC